MKPQDLRGIVISAVMASFALTLPMAFHATGLGNRFLPMLLPILLNGFLSPMRWAIFTGALVPVASAFITGMPPLYPPVALVMSLACALMAATAAGLYRLTKPRIWPALIAAILVDRCVSTVLMWSLAGRFGLPPAVFSLGAFAFGLPGVVLQLMVVPPVVSACMRRKGILFRSHNESEAPIFQ